MKKIIFLVSLCFVQAGLASTLPNYYPTSFVESEFQDEELKEQLFKILNQAHLKNEDARDILVPNCKDDQDKCYSQRRDISYKEARRYLFGMLHLEREQGEYWVQDTYCRKWVDSSDGIGEMQIPNHLVMNCEHTWPQSKFNTGFSKNLQKTDLHHLYPTDNRANSSRGNKIFAEVDGIPVNKNCAASLKGVAIGSENVLAFQPPAEHRGNVARALFYFSIRYKSPIDPLQEGFLKKWHHEDPVDDQERLRNQEIMKIQGNRNPFIDAPDLVNSIQDF